MSVIGRRGSKRPKVDQRTAWRDVAESVEGGLVLGKSPEQDKVLMAHGPWRIWLDTYAVHTGQATIKYTRVRAFFLGWRELQLTVRGVGLLDRLWRALRGGPDPGLAHGVRDKYVIKGKPKARLPSLLVASGLTGALMEAGKVNLSVRPASRKLRQRYGEGIAVVTCQVTNVLTDARRLAAMLHLVAATLDALAGIGEASREEVPNP